MSIRIQTPAHSAPTPTRRSCHAAALIGVLFDDVPPRTDSHTPVDLSLTPGSVTLITGPSGSGKTSLMRALRHAVGRAGWRIIDVDQIKLPAKPAVDLLGTDAPSAMRTLAQAGLAEAMCFLRRPEELSQGQRERLALAVAMDRAEKQASTNHGAEKGKTVRRATVTRTSRPSSVRSSSHTANVLLYADEFAARLDRATAKSVARSFSDAVRRNGQIVAVLATSHDDLESALRPDEMVRVSLDGQTSVHRASHRQHKEEYAFDITEGSMRDYMNLAWLHYRSGSPAAPVKTLCARELHSGEVIGILVVSMPTLNGVWRRLAWGDRYHTGDKRLDARRLNAEVRRIARVVVDPRYRGLGVATSLVSAYLHNPLTVCTEAVTAMGQWSRFFEAASMTRYELATPPAHARLLDALDYAGVEPYRLATPASAWRRATQGAGEAFIAHELRLWARRRRCDRSLPRDDLGALWRRACRRIGVGMAAYAHGSPEEP